MAARARFRGSGRNQARGVAPLPSLRGAALTLLSRRDYTTHELRTKLADRGYPADDTDRLMRELAASGALDDRRVAAAHVRTATAVKGRGSVRIKRELSARGLPSDVIAEALSAVGRADEAAALKRILLRKKWPAKHTLAERRRMLQHLMRKGFTLEAIRLALGRTDGDDEVEPE